MTAAQLTAFEEGTGGYIIADDLLWTIQAIGSTAVFLYVAWLCIAAYNDYGDGAIKANDMIFVWLRGVFVMMVLIYMLVP